MRRLCKLVVLFIMVLFSRISLAQEITYKGFLDINASANKNYSTFGFGGFDNFVSSQLSDKLSFIGEIIVQPKEGQEFRVDVERIHITYEFNDNFKIKVGRFYAPIGYYTTNFYSDHAAIFTPSIARPAILAYEDDGGVLETRATGVMFSASNLTALNLSYDFALTNGIGSSVAGDNDKNKAVTMRLTANPFEGLSFGAGARFDKLDATTISRVSNVELGESVTSNNFSAFGAYNKGKWLLIGEYYSIVNQSNSVGTVKSQGAFAYAGYTIKNKLTPYVQYDYLDIAANDVYYSNAGNESGFDWGVKYAFSYKSVLKAEYHVDSQTGYLQYAIGF
ncbi:hypothetical protein WSM22_19300 [Cytophagales bacterium WSM2-2]|nr:hypothetical protein WSM22_19300 [Cytophagales bacterium WSM2-2]